MSGLTEREVLERELTIWRNPTQQQEVNPLGNSDMFNSESETEYESENFEGYDVDQTLSEAEQLLASLEGEQ
jgi:hypothetical protein